MSLIVSTPRGLQIIGGRVLLLTSLAWCLAPVLVGAIGWPLASPSGTAKARINVTDLHSIFYLLMLTPLVTGPFWMAVTVATALFTRRGLYGWLIAALSGAVVGSIAAWVAEAPSLLLFGAILASLHRFTLALIRPAAF